MIPTPVRAIFFYAVGTLIQPDPPAAVVYAAAGRRHGSRLDAASVAGRFAAAFRREESLDHELGLRTDDGYANTE